MIKIITKVEPNNSTAQPVKFEELLENYLRDGWGLVNTGHQLLPDPSRAAQARPDDYIIYSWACLRQPRSLISYAGE